MTESRYQDKESHADWCTVMHSIIVVKMNFYIRRMPDQSQAFELILH
ncbi:MAG: hypothetical protein J1E16_09785 [Muribaculaceae bacterium]|nr:hypothetical protein [Muribaculaceae bacterium]